MILVPSSKLLVLWSADNQSCQISACALHSVDLDGWNRSILPSPRARRPGVRSAAAAAAMRWPGPLCEATAPSLATAGPDDGKPAGTAGKALDGTLALGGLGGDRSNLFGVDLFFAPIAPDWGPVVGGGGGIGGLPGFGPRPGGWAPGGGGGALLARVGAFWPH